MRNKCKVQAELRIVHMQLIGIRESSPYANCTSLEARRDALEAELLAIDAEERRRVKGDEPDQGPADDPHDRPGWIVRFLNYITGDREAA